MSKLEFPCEKARADRLTGKLPIRSAGEYALGTEVSLASGNECLFKVKGTEAVGLFESRLVSSFRSKSQYSRVGVLGSAEAR